MNLAGNEPRAVIFDFGNVLCFPPTEEQFAIPARRAGLSTPDFITAFWHDRIEYDCGKNARQYWERVAGRALSGEELNGFIHDEIELWSRFDQRVLAWARELKEAGLKTGILSNLPRTLGESLRRRPGFLEHFDHVTFSYELNLVKPEPDIYRHAVEGLGLAASKALFLDDRPENVEGARKIGLPAHQFTTWEQFVADELPKLALPAPNSM